MVDTDSELKRLWDRSMARWEDYQRTKQLPPGVSDAETFRQDTRRELDLLRMRWREILARRKRGELTDRTAVDAVRKLAGDVAKLHGIKVTFSEDEGEHQNEFHLASHWLVRMTYAGEPKALNETTWLKLVEKIDAEVKDLEFVDPEDSLDSYWSRPKDDGSDLVPASVLAGYTDEGWEDDEEDEEEEDEPEDVEPEFTPPSHSWSVDTWVWLGPPSKMPKELR